ncbi:hypothetical protein JYU34_010773 [Plutella xylostella]|uniref:Aminopeptidase P N-terminal domain-containing protein n=1 Tax=Plutella xylostella TaxID=51655 RepID=A0ABQ7QF78_PLUXY|nr:hypothetical protein JYU34_010773 [Plutella xylostella]
MQTLRQLVLASGFKMRRKVFTQTFCQEKYKRYSTTPPGVKAEQQFSIPKGILGQPTCHTHPHMIGPGQLTCGITQAEYRERRETLVAKLLAESQDAHKNHIIVIPAACKQYMSDKIPYTFRQNSDFYYLTGCLEPSAVLVILKTPQTEDFKSILFVHDKDAQAELWEGPRSGCAAAARLFAVDEARPVESFQNFLNKTTASSRSTLWYHSESPANPELHPSIRASLRDSTTLADPQRSLHFMRVIKSPAEIELMRETCYVGAQAINMAMACTKPGISESIVQAVLDYSCRQAGAEHPAFPPVVAGAARATHIHYVANNQLLGDGDLLLVDSGSQRWLYNSDISRTWPVSGHYSKHQRILYELVLAVQKRLIELLSEYRPPLDQLFDSMCRLLGQHLQQEGILPRNIDGNELIGKAYRLCPHHVSHYLGLDVHDTPLVRRSQPVTSGMVVTVEPGIYIRPDDDSVPIEFRGCGVRVEDDVLLTDAGADVLTALCVKEVADVEAIVGKHSL